MSGLPLPPGAQQPAVPIQFAQQEAGVVPGDLQVVRAAQVHCGFGEGAQGKRIPADQHFVVSSGLGAAAAVIQQSGLDLQYAPAEFIHHHFQLFHFGFPGLVPLQDVPALKIAGRGKRVDACEELEIFLAADGFTQLRRGPEIGQALLAVDIRVQAGDKPAAGEPHLTDEEVQRLRTHDALVFAAGQQAGVQVGQGKLGVVIQHFLEMGHQPFAVGGVAVETAPDHIIHAAAGHGFQRMRGGGERIFESPHALRQQELDGHRLGEFGRLAPAAVLHVVRSQDRRGCPVQHGAVDLFRGLQADPLDAVAKMLGQAGRDGVDFTAITAPDGDDAVQNIYEGGHPLAAARGEVGAAVERLSRWGQEDGHWPAALTGHCDHGVHVNGVQVWTFLAVHFDADEVLVQDAGCLLILKGFVRHHMTPVTGRIADAEEDGLVFLPRSFQGFFAPRVPVDRIVCVLQKVRGYFAG